jgi:hypothetical protein
MCDLTQGTAFVAIQAEDYGRAALLYGALDHFLSESGEKLEPRIAKDRDAGLERCRAELGGARFDELFASGRSLDKPALGQLILRDFDERKREIVNARP